MRKLLIVLLLPLWSFGQSTLSEQMKNELGNRFDMSPFGLWVEFVL